MCEHAGIGFFPHTSSVLVLPLLFFPPLSGHFRSLTWARWAITHYSVAAIYVKQQLLSILCVVYWNRVWDAKNNIQQSLNTKDTSMSLLLCCQHMFMQDQHESPFSFFFQANSLLGLVFLRSMWGNWVTKHTKQIPWWSPVCYFGPQNPV